MSSYEDLQDALHIAQVERDKWKARAIKLANVLGIRVCDIDVYKAENANWVGIDQEPHEIYECNACGWLLYNEDRTDFKYCPNCGRKMEDISE